MTAVFSARFWPLVWAIVSPLASSAAVLITCGPGTISGSVVWSKGATNGVPFKRRGDRVDVVGCQRVEGRFAADAVGVLVHQVADVRRSS